MCMRVCARVRTYVGECARVCGYPRWCVFVCMYLQCLHIMLWWSPCGTHAAWGGGQVGFTVGWTGVTGVLDLVTGGLSHIHIPRASRAPAGFDSLLSDISPARQPAEASRPRLSWMSCSAPPSLLLCSGVGTVGILGLGRTVGGVASRPAIVDDPLLIKYGPPSGLLAGCFFFVQPGRQCGSARALCACWQQCQATWTMG